MWIDSIPKAELHCHLDGSVPVDILRKLCDKELVRIPEDQEAFCRMVQAGEDCQSLAEYLKSFNIPLSCLKSEEAFYLAAYHTACAAAGERVRYMEIRFAPLLSVSEKLSPESVIEAAAAGLMKAETEHEITARLILCGMRQFTEEMNLRNLELAKAYMGRGVVGVDLAGDEAAFPNELFREYFQRARAAEIPFTIHSGSAAAAAILSWLWNTGRPGLGTVLPCGGTQRLKSCAGGTVWVWKCVPGAIFRPRPWRVWRNTP